MKKTKLFLSVCMMCLCVAVLCMGILAASSATYQINGNISYNMIDGVSLINTRVYKVAYDGSSTVATMKTQMESRVNTLATMKLSEIEANQDPIYALSEKKDYFKYSTSVVTNEDKVSITYGKSTDDESTYYMYFVVINITNLSTDTGYCLNATINETLSNTSTSYVSTNQSQSKIKSGSFANIVIGISAMSTTYSSTSEDFAYTLTVNYVEAPDVTVQTYIYSTDVGASASTYTKASALRTDATAMETATTAISGTTISSATSNVQLSDTAQTLSTGSQTIDYSTAKTYWIVSEVKNESSETAYVKITDLAEYDFLTSGSFIYRSGDIISLKAGETSRVVASLAQWTGSQTLSSTTFGFTL